MKNVTKYIMEKIKLSDDRFNKKIPNDKYEHYKKIDDFDIMWNCKECYVECKEDGSKFNLLDDDERSKYLNQYRIGDFKKNSYFYDFECEIIDNYNNDTYTIITGIYCSGTNVNEIGVDVEDFNLSPKRNNELAHALDKSIIDDISEKWMIVFDWNGKILLKNIIDS
jgi:hypothetical protein